jgi:4-amino-4-deoxy-L-arabinose transferase-like glycosyltransferase
MFHTGRRPMLGFMTTPVTTARIPSVRPGRIVTVLVAPAAAMLIWLVQGPHLTVRTGNTATSVGPAAVIATSLAAGLAGWLLLAILERYSARPRRAWTVIASAVLVLSLLGPILYSVTAPTAGALIAMHAVVGVILITGLSRRARSRG